jgi:hypothetical protein
MSPRERYVETLTFGAPDRVPFEPGGPRESTLTAWREQGLPEGVSWYRALLDELGITPEHTQPQVNVHPNFRMHPAFEEKVLAHERGHYLVQDWMGAIVEISDRYDYTYLRQAKDFVTRKWHRFPVQTRADWERMKERYDPHDPARQPADVEAAAKAARDRDYVLGLSFNGPFWQLREWLGFEGLCTMMADDPDFVQELCEFWTEFVSAVMRPVLARVQFDSVLISEDMAFKEHSMISPAMARRFLLPAYRRWAEEVRASGCPILDMDSDGYVADLLPVWMEGGINCCCPVEVAAGNDIVAYRGRYGRRMAFHGGIDKRAIARGGEAMRAEVRRVVPPLLAAGGFIPSCDHGVPPDISWPDFVEYARLVAELTGWA